MWRAFFCAIGIMLLILGVECLVIDNATLAAGVVEEGAANVNGMYSPLPNANAGRIFKPAEWMPWSCLASGAVVVLYSLTLHRNFGGGGG